MRVIFVIINDCFLFYLIKKTAKKVGHQKITPDPALLCTFNKKVHKISIEKNLF